MPDPDNEDLTPGQRMIIDQLRHLGGPIDAERYAYAAFSRDIEELGAEELEEIPTFLLEPWLEQHPNN